MSVDRLSETAAKGVLGLATARDIVETATLALATGHDSESLRNILALPDSTTDEAWALFRQALQELGLVLPARREAVLTLATDIAHAILAGEVSAYDGAKQIWEFATQVSDEPIGGLDPFIYAGSEWEERPDDRDFFDGAIVDAARDLVDARNGRDIIATDPAS
jgi:hypothetical protein